MEMEGAGEGAAWGWIIRLTVGGKWVVVTVRRLRDGRPRSVRPAASVRPRYWTQPIGPEPPPISLQFLWGSRHVISDRGGGRGCTAPFPPRQAGRRSTSVAAGDGTRLPSVTLTGTCRGVGEDGPQASERDVRICTRPGLGSPLAHGFGAIARQLNDPDAKRLAA